MLLNICWKLKFDNQTTHEQHIPELGDRNKVTEDFEFPVKKKNKIIIFHIFKTNQKVSKLSKLSLQKVLKL